MAKKNKRVSAKGKARVKRAGPRPTQNSIGNIFGDNPPSGMEVGKVLGEALAKVITKKVNDDKGFDIGLAARAENSAKADAMMRDPANDGQIVLRTPDSQLVTWTFQSLNPQDAQYDEDPLRTKLAVPTSITWTWYPHPELANPRIVSYLAFPDDPFADAEYSTSIEMGFATTVLRSQHHGEVKNFAEALLSAYDWKSSWKAVLGEETSSKQWQDYDLRKVRSESVAKESGH